MKILKPRMHSLLKNEFIALALAFVVIFVAITVPSWWIIASAGPEISDFASNSLLILKAKHLSLLQGNYSRMDFFHPGPALLYVLAAGELMFFDLLHFVRQPVSAQLLAVAIYNSIWITTTIHLLRRLGAGWHDLVFLLVGTMVFMASQERESFDGLWFPHLYIAPFLCLTIGLGSIAISARSGWIASAVSVGFLINGQASFIGICGVMCAISFASNLMLGPSRASNNRIWLGSRREFTRDWRILGAATGILVILLLPFFTRNLIETPPPLKQYLELGRHSERHDFMAGVNYLWSFWGTSTWYKCLSVTSLFIVIIGTRQRQLPSAALIGCLISTTAAVLYAMNGVDDLKFKYLELFYLTTPSLLVGGAMMFVGKLIRSHNIKIGAIAAGIAGILLFGLLISRPPSYASGYSSPDMMLLNNKLLELQAAGLIVLDIADDPTGLSTSVSVGIEVLHLRNQQPRMCVGRGWNASLTLDLKCSEDELINERHVKIAPAGSKQTSMRAIFEAGGLNLYEADIPCLSQGKMLSVANDAAAFQNSILASGWSPVEGSFTWSTSRSAYLRFCVDPGVTGVRLRLGAYSPSPQYPQRAELEVNGNDLGSQVFTSLEPKAIAIPIMSKQVLLRIVSPDRISPHALVGSPDMRELGVSIWGIEAF